MTNTVLIDVDVALKSCRYRLEETLVSCTTLGGPPGLLAIGKFSLRSRVGRDRNIRDSKAAKSAVDWLIDRVRIVEPTEEEIRVAEDLEEQAATEGLEFDTGESQLLAVLIRRGARLLVTGDKRAIVAIHRLGVQGVDRSIACFEQLMASIAKRLGYRTVRSHVCEETAVDKAVTICFACSQTGIREQQVRQGLRSYVDDLRRSCGDLLIQSLDLSAVIP